MKLTFSNVEKEYVPLNATQMAGIIGGKGIKLSDDQLKAMFNYSGLTEGFSGAAGRLFNTQIRLLASTDAGASLLLTLADNITPSTKINISSASGPTGSLGSYNQNTNTLVLGNFANLLLSNPQVEANTLGIFAHELYHAFEDYFGKYWDNRTTKEHISVEIDAYLFQSRVLWQVDAIRGGNSDLYHLNGFGSVEDWIPNGIGGNGTAAFQDPFVGAVKNGNLTLAGYNALIANFYKTQFGNSGLYPDTRYDTTALTSLSEITVNKILFNDGNKLVKNVPGTGPVVIDVDLGPGGPYEDYGTDWDSADPFHNPGDYGYDPNFGTFGDWFDFNNTNYEGTPSEGGNPNTGGTDSDWTSPYNTYWYNPETGVYNDLPAGNHPLDGFVFLYSDDPTNHLGLDQNGFNPSGFDQNGFDADGYDMYGYDADGYNWMGYDQNGYDMAGFDESGFDENGYDMFGYDMFGYDENGYDMEGYDENGYDENGYDQEGYDENGEDENGNTREENGDYE